MPSEKPFGLEGGMERTPVPAVETATIRTGQGSSPIDRSSRLSIRPGNSRPRVDTLSHDGIPCRPEPGKLRGTQLAVVTLRAPKRDFRLLGKVLHAACPAIHRGGPRLCPVPVCQHHAPGAQRRSRLHEPPQGTVPRGAKALRSVREKGPLAMDALAA